MYRANICALFDLLLSFRGRLGVKWARTKTFEADMPLVGSTFEASFRGRLGV